MGPYRKSGGGLSTSLNTSSSTAGLAPLMQLKESLAMHGDGPGAVVALAGVRAEREPSESDLSVVFKGDDEPKTPAALISRLAEMESRNELDVDSYSLGGTVEKLEETAARMLGKEAAVFMPTGTLANHLALRRLCGSRLRAVVQEQSHLYNDSGDCATRLSGINLIPLAKDRPHFTLDELTQAVDRSESGRVATPIGAMMVESPVRRQAGQVMPYGEMVAVTTFCDERGIATHLDGARLYMMAAATGIEPKVFAALFDTVYVSLYKYFGAPYGAVLAGTSECIADLYHDRRMFGGGLASAFMAAALALRGMEGFEERFGNAMTKAHALFERLSGLPGLRVGQFENGSNIFPAELSGNVDLTAFVSALRERLIFIYPDENANDRLNLAVNTSILRVNNDEIVESFEYALTQACLAGC